MSSLGPYSGVLKILREARSILAFLDNPLSYLKLKAFQSWHVYKVLLNFLIELHAYLYHFLKRGGGIACSNGKETKKYSNLGREEIS